MAKGLVPTLPKDITKLSDGELADLLAEAEATAGLIDAEDAETLEGLTADEIITEFKAVAETIMALREETTKREEDAERFAEAKAEINASLKGETVKAEEDVAADDEAKDDDAAADDDEAKDDDDEAKTEDEAEADESEVKDPVREKVLVAAADTEEAVEPVRPLRRTAPTVPTPAKDRIVVNEPAPLAFVSSGLVPSTPPGTVLATRGEIADAQKRMMDGLGRPSKSRDGREDRYRVATLDYRRNFPEDRVLVAGDLGGNGAKVAAVGSPYFADGLDALVASGGLCAPLEPIYTMPQLATRARPVRDSLPSFRAERGGINVPTPTTVSDAAGAITVITEAEDALGGTFATKACLDMDCPNYTETAVTIISHCREFGNLNAMAWPEKIAHENEITMAEHARVAEGYLLNRIKAQSIAVTGGATTLGALIYLVDVLEKAEYGIRSRLRMPSEARFQFLAPRVLLDMLLVDTIANQFDRYRTESDINSYLASIGIDVTWYIDTASPRPGVADGVSQIADAAQGAGAVEGFPSVYEAAFFPAGTFLHLDMAELNLGIVRDSTLNSTNDFQIFGESFENVALIGPAQAAYWMTLDICPTGAFPPLGTVRTCE